MDKSRIVKYRLGILAAIALSFFGLLGMVLFNITADAKAGSQDDIAVSADASQDTTVSIGNVSDDKSADVNSEANTTSDQSSGGKLVNSDGGIMEGLVRRSFGASNKGDDIPANAFYYYEDEVDADNVAYVDVTSEDEVTYLSLYNKGTTDRSVAYIQQRLMELGFMEYAEPTEYYGSITMQAVRLFQRQNDLKPDGIAGEQTLAMLMSPDAKSYLVKNGMEGSDVTVIQTRLYELGYLAKKNFITGIFGDETERAVKAMQSANGLLSDGKVGEMTINLLYSEEVKANLLSFGDKNDIVLECQNRLKELGYLTTTPDGSYGNDTLAAVKLFQSRNDLVVDGYLGPTTRDLLMSSGARPNGLTLGAEGDTVKSIQKKLIKLGYMSSGSATGYFGEVTENAVKAFQRNNGLTVDGDVGVKTMTKLTGGDAVKATGGSTGGGSDSGHSGETGTGGSGESGTGGDTGTATGSVKNLLKVALSKLGCKYVYGAKGPDKFDCSGFVYWCLNQVGVRQSYITSYGWRTIGKYKKITSFSSLKAGDVIVVYGHVGIVGENGTVIDASSSNGKIVHRDLSSWWKNNFVCGWRIFD